MKKFNKNTLDLDIQIAIGSSIRWLSGGVIVAVLLICAAVNLPLWQWFVMIVCALVLTADIYSRQKRGVCHMSVREIDGIWLLSEPNLSANTRSKMPVLRQQSSIKHPKNSHQNQSVVHQAYLHHIKAVPLGITQALVLDFYVILPRKRRLSMVLFQDQLTPYCFSKLLALTRLMK